MVAGAAVAAATVVGATVVSVLELLLLLPHPVKQSVAVTAQTQSAHAPMTVAVVFLFVVFFILITSFLKFIFVFCVFVSAVPIYYHIIF